MQQATCSDYLGRFAPTPSGPLHFGSLVAALGSYLDARAHQGRWLVRIEDVDLPRCKPGADTLILETLERFGLHWDESVIWQSQRFELYRETLQQLSQQQLTYPCQCSRKQIKAVGGHQDASCRQSPASANDASAVRFVNHHPVTGFIDRAQGKIRIPAEQAQQDFILYRRDQLPAYQLAVVVDDIAQGVNQVVRGTDLLHATSWQLSLYAALNASPPAYLHLPLVLDQHGNKLSKQNHAAPLISESVVPQLHAAMNFLGLPVSRAQLDATRDQLLDWGIQAWRTQLV